MASEFLIKLIKIKQQEIDKLETLKMFYKENDKEKKISEQLIILDWLNKRITKITDGIV